MAKTQKRVILGASEKGGVGKSVFSRAFVDYVRASGKKVAAYDADGSVGGLLRVHGTRADNGSLEPTQDPMKGVAYYNGRSDNERAALLDSIAHGHAVYYHDLAGGLLADLTRIVDAGSNLDGLLEAFASHGYRLTICHLISPDVGSTQSVSRWIELVGDRADHVAVVNLRNGKPPADFPFWFGFTDGSGVQKGGKTREKLLALNGVEIELPAIPSGTFAKLDAENFSFSSAVSAPVFTITERAHIAKFQRDFAAAIAPAAPLLGF